MSKIKLQNRSNSASQNIKISLETREMIYDRLSFNLSFITNKTQYSLDNLQLKTYKKIISVMQILSNQNIVSILNLRKEHGFEFIESLDKEIIHSEFMTSGRFDQCVKGYCVFRIANMGRVIGKLNNNMFYVLAIDTQFELYKH